LKTAAAIIHIVNARTALAARIANAPPANPALVVAIVISDKKNTCTLQGNAPYNRGYNIFFYGGVVYGK
jgi:hypothetical protein